MRLIAHGCSLVFTFANVTQSQKNTGSRTSHQADVYVAKWWMLDIIVDINIILHAFLATIAQRTPIIECLWWPIKCNVIGWNMFLDKHSIWWFTNWLIGYMDLTWRISFSFEQEERHSQATWFWDPVEKYWINLVKCYSLSISNYYAG